MTDTGTSASGVAVDDQGNIYAADVGFNNSQEVRADYGGAVPKAASSTVNDQSRFADSTRMWKTRGSSAA